MQIAWKIINCGIFIFENNIVVYCVEDKKQLSMKGTENQILIIFGASGDLTKRKLIPALIRII